MQYKFIKPSDPELVLRNHQKAMAAVPPEGELVLWDSTWVRRVRDGSAVLVNPEKPAAEKTPEAQPEVQQKQAPKTFVGEAKVADPKTENPKPKSDRG